MERGYHHGDLRKALLEGVVEMIREHGPLALSLRELARRSRVSHAAPAHHFRNKRGLLTALATEGFERLGRSILDELERSGAATGPKQLGAIGRGYVRFARENPSHFAVMFRVELLDESDAAFMATADACFGLLMATVQRCATDGLLPPQEVETVAIGAWSLVHGFAALWNDGRLLDRVEDGDPDRWAERICRLFVDAVFPPQRTTASPEGG